MQTNKMRLTVIAGATLALVIAGTASVAASGPRDNDRGFGPGIGRGMDEFGPMRLGPGGYMGADPAGFERREVTLQTADGITVDRVENGVVDAVADTSLGFSLGSGEAVTVSIDDSTQIVAVNEETVQRRGWNRQMMVPTEITAADIAVGANVIVWSTSEDGTQFLAERIVVEPATAATTDETAPATEDVPATTDAEASPAAA